jgi:dihydrofolate reductase
VTIESRQPRMTIHMVASLDRFIARRDGSVGWLETSDTLAPGETLTPETIAAFLQAIDCYVMGRAHTRWRRVSKPRGWGGPTATKRLKPHFHSIWLVGGGVLSGECLRLRLADEVRYSIVPRLATASRSSMAEGGPRPAPSGHDRIQERHGGLR